MSNFQPLEVVGRGSDAQLQVDENFNKLTQQDMPIKYLTRYLVYTFLYSLTNAVQRNRQCSCLFVK